MFQWLRNWWQAYHKKHASKVVITKEEKMKTERITFRLTKKLKDKIVSRGGSRWLHIAAERSEVEAVKRKKE
jgi:hypothetical protein